MVDDPSSVTEDAGEAVTRVCRQCGKAVQLEAEYAGMTVKCSSCGSALKPGAAEAVQPIEYVERENRLASMAGWTGSVVVHAGFLMLFTGVTWLSGFSAGGGGAEVGIVAEDDGTTIEAPDVEPPRIEAPSSELTTAQIQGLIQVEPSIANLEVGSTVSELATVLPVDVGAGDTSATAESDWSSLLSDGGEVTVGGSAIFGFASRGSKFVYVVDYSGSMRGRKLRFAKAELIRQINSLKRWMRFYIIFYDHLAEPMDAPGLAPATRRNKAKYFQWVGRVTGGGGTDPTEAMTTALSLKPHTVWLLSDGSFGEGACNAIRSANRGSRVNTIAYGHREGEPVLRRIAEENNGKYRFVPPEEIGLIP